jgi:hypothetical protein
MQKKCFVFVPTSDPDGYSKGHFNRVYQYIIVPACKSAGFTPSRADDPDTSLTGSEILKTIIDSDISICDLSTNNSNALYGFTIRYAINLPVILLKDTKTNLKFNFREFEAVEYDESLRIDTVQNEIESLSDMLKKTFANKLEINSLLNRLHIGSLQETEIQNYAAPSEGIEKKESQLPVISPLPDYVSDPITKHEEIEKLKTGDFIFHMNYGKGELKTIKKMGNDKFAEVGFESGSKMLILVTTGVLRKIKS